MCNPLRFPQVFFLKATTVHSKKLQRQFNPHRMSEDSANTNTLAVPINLTHHTSHITHHTSHITHHTSQLTTHKKARLNLINRAGLSPREDDSHWCQAQGNNVAPARSVKIRFSKKAFAHAGERSLRSNTCKNILRLLFGSSKSFNLVENP